MKKTIILLILFSTNVLAGDVLFLSRLNEQKYSLSAYYSNRSTIGKYDISGSNISWNFQWQETILQPSMRIGEKTNLFGKLGISDIRRKQNSSNIEQEGNFGSGSIFGIGLDCQIRQETYGFPLLNLCFSLTNYSTTLKKTIWYEPNGTMHENTENTGTSMFETQIALVASKKYGNITFSGGIEEGIITGSDFDEYAAYMHKDDIEVVDGELVVKNLFFILLDENYDYYYWKEKYPDYCFVQLNRVYHVTNTNINLEAKMDFLSGNSIILGLVAGNETAISLCFNMVFGR